MSDLAGLTSHPKRPFVMASCSRDSTMRLWSLTPLVQPLEINILAEKPWQEILVSQGRSLTHAHSCTDMSVSQLGMFTIGKLTVILCSTMYFVVFSELSSIM